MLLFTLGAGVSTGGGFSHPVSIGYGRTGALLPVTGSVFAQRIGTGKNNLHLPPVDPVGFLWSFRISYRVGAPRNWIALYFMIEKWCSLIRSMNRLKTMVPRMTARIMGAANANRAFTWSSFTPKKKKYAAIIYRAVCAMFKIRPPLNTRENPKARVAYIPPVSSPLINICPNMFFF